MAIRKGWRQAFLTALSNCGIIVVACESAGIDRSHVYKIKHKDEKFAQAWESAKEVAVERLEAHCRALATDEKNVIATIFLLKSLKPQVYNREPYVTPPEAQQAGRDFHFNVSIEPPERCLPVALVSKLDVLQRTGGVGWEKICEQFGVPTGSQPVAPPPPRGS